MDHLPLTRSGPFEEITAPGVIETLFPELPLPGSRPVEITATMPCEGSRRTVMQIVVSQDGAAQAFGMALRECAGIEGFEVTARRFEG